MYPPSTRLPLTAALVLALAAACNPPKKDDTATTSASSSAPSAGSASAADEIPSVNIPQPAPAPSAIPAPADVATPPADAKKTASGLAYKILTAGTGKDHPGPNDKVKVNYTGWTSDGKMFDSSVVHGGPAQFGVGDVIPGWTEGLQLLKVGDKARFWIPGKLAYGDKPQMGAPAGQLTFDVELLEIAVAPKAPDVPKDVAAPPANATKTASGLAYRILTPAKDPNAPKPTATSMVTVNYTGWTTDGKMFDSSVTRGQPATFPLGRVIKGWTEGLQLMKVGDKARFWIPKELAYEDPSRPARPGVPLGMLVFDVELLDVKQGPPGMPMPPPQPH